MTVICIFDNFAEAKVRGREKNGGGYVIPREKEQGPRLWQWL